MAKVVFILGLAGAGKTTLSDRMMEQHSYVRIDGAFDRDWNRELFEQNYAFLISSPRNDTDCIVFEIELSRASKRQYVVQRLLRDVPDVQIIWKCFKNDKDKAAINARKRPVGV